MSETRFDAFLLRFRSHGDKMCFPKPQFASRTSSAAIVVDMQPCFEHGGVRQQYAITEWN